MIDVESGEVLYELADDVIATTTVFSPDGRLFATGGYSHRVQIFDAETGNRLAILNTFSDALAFSPDGQTLAVASGWDIQLWDVERLLGHEEE